MQEEMAKVSWVSLCVLVVVSAIPLTERGVTVDTNKSFPIVPEKNDNIQNNEPVDGAIEKTSALYRSENHILCDDCSNTEHKPRESKTALKTFITRFDNVTRKLHSGMKQIYSFYRYGTKGVHSSNIMSTISAHLGAVIPSLARPNISFQTQANTVSTKWKYFSPDRTDSVSNDIKSANSTEFRPHLRQLKQHLFDEEWRKNQMDFKGNKHMIKNVNVSADGDVQIGIPTLQESDVDSTTTDSVDVNNSLTAEEETNLQSDVDSTTTDSVDVSDSATVEEETHLQSDMDSTTTDSVDVNNSETAEEETHLQSDMDSTTTDSVNVNNSATAVEEKNLQSDLDSSTPYYGDVKNSTTASEGPFDEFIKCQHVPGFNDLRWLKMVALCPQTWTNEEVRVKCQFWEQLDAVTIMDELTFLPIQDENGTVYANVYCATCHHATYLLPWTSRFDCNKTTPQAYQISDFTNLDFLYSNLLTSTCQRQIIPAISETLEKCDAGVIQPYLYARKGASSDMMSASYPVSFTVLLNFDFTGNTHILFTANQKVVEEEHSPKCQMGETFDPYTKSCRQLLCDDDYTLVGNDCVPSGDTSPSPDDITNLSQLRTVDIVTLQVNISVGDYLFLRFQNLEPDIVPQIAGQLNISVDRIKDVNISYELSSVDRSHFQVATLTEEEYTTLTEEEYTPLTEEEYTTLTEDEYHHMLPQHQLHVETSDEHPGTASTPTTKPSKIDIVDPTGSGILKPKEKTRKDIIASETLTSKGTKILSSLQSAPAEVTFTVQPNKWPTRSPRNITLNYEQDINNNVSAPAHSNDRTSQQMGSMSKYHSGIVDTLTRNLSEHNPVEYHRFLQHVFKHKGKLMKTTYEDFVRYHLEFPDNGTNLYVSAPVNTNNDRVSLLVQGSVNLESLLDENIVMKISFVFVQPDDPESTEVTSRDLLRKIDSLIFEQQFTLKLNGNDMDVVAVNDINDNTDEVTFCLWGVEYLVYDDEFMMIAMNNSTVLYVNETNSYVGVGMFDLFMLLSGSNNAGQTNFTAITQYAFVCFMPRISQHDCDMIDLTKDEYHIAGDNKSIVFEDKLYDIFQYRVVDETTGSIQICVPPTFNTRNVAVISYITTIDTSCSSEFDGFLKAEGYMTLVLGRVSIVALTCVIVTYMLFRSLRNLPGLSLMNLTFALLVTQIIFAEGIGENRTWLCKAVAVSLHYMLLAAHFWMNVMSYDVFKTFTNPLILTRPRAISKYLFRYVLYAWGIPLVIVSFCMVVDFSHLFNGVSIGYGDTSSPDVTENYDNETTDAHENVVSSSNSNSSSSNNSNNTDFADVQTIHSCWITQPLAALVAFGAIILLIFLVNCVLFGKTIASISKTAKMAKKNLTNRNSSSSYHKVTASSEVMLYVRMSTVMGFTWIFGLSSCILSSFVTLPTDVACTVIHVVSIVFIILNTSQGLFIFVAFVCNRRVWGLYVNLFHKVRLLVGSRRRESLFSVSSTVSSSHNAHS